MTARNNKLLKFLSANPDMLTPSQAARVEAISKVSGPVGALGVVGGSNQPSEVERLALENMKLQLALERAESASIAVIRSARRASSGQDLVLRETLLHLAREVGEPLNTCI